MELTHNRIVPLADGQCVFIVAVEMVAGGLHRNLHSLRLADFQLLSCRLIGGSNGPISSQNNHALGNIVHGTVQRTQQGSLVFLRDVFLGFGGNELRNLPQKLHVQLFTCQNPVFLLPGGTHQANNADDLIAHPDRHRNLNLLPAAMAEGTRLTDFFPAWLIDYLCLSRLQNVSVHISFFGHILINFFAEHPCTCHAEKPVVHHFHINVRNLRDNVRVFHYRVLNSRQQVAHGTQPPPFFLYCTMFAKISQQIIPVCV